VSYWALVGGGLSAHMGEHILGEHILHDARG
jgi:hypothetical protein